MHLDKKTLDFFKQAGSKGGKQTAKKGKKYMSDLAKKRWASHKLNMEGIK